MSDAPTPAQAGSTPERAEYRSRRGRRLLIAIIILLLLGLGAITVLLLSLIAPRGGVASSEETNGIQWVRSIYGWGETPAEQLMAPQEVFIDRRGTIWVADANYGDRAIAFNPEGKLVGFTGTEMKEPMITVGPLAVGIEDRLFVGESSMDRMRVFDDNGDELGGFGVPNPIDIDTQGDTMAIGSQAGFVIVNPETGEPVRVVGSRGKGQDQFDTVNGVAIAEDGTIYVTDAYNNRLSAYNTEGERLWMVETGAPANQINVTGGGAMAASSDTTAPARLQLPGDVTIDGRGRLVVVDALDFSIAVFSAENGEFLAKYGEYGAKDGQFIYPSSIAYDAQRDWFAVADAGNGRVQIVRIPDSSSSVDPLAAIRRTLSGPLRACLVPLLLLLILIVAFVLNSRRRKKREAERLAAAAAAAELSPVGADEVAGDESDSAPETPVENGDVGT